MDKKIELTWDESEKIKEVINSFLQNGASDVHPRMVILTGPIASGKTTIRKEKYSKDFVLIDSGELYDAFHQKDGEDSEKLEGYLMVAGIELVRRAIADKKNIIIEISADNDERGAKVKQIADTLKSIGYAVEIEYIHCEPEECIKRNAKGRDNVSSYYSTDETLHYFLVNLPNLQ